MQLGLRDKPSKGNSNSIRCFPASFSPFLLPPDSLHAPCSSQLLVSCFLPTFFTQRIYIALRPMCSYFLTSLPCRDFLSLSSNLKLPMKVLFGSSWILLPTQGFSVWWPHLEWMGVNSPTKGGLLSLDRQSTKEIHGYRLLFGVVSKKQIVCVNILHHTSICQGLFQETLFLTVTSFLFLSNVK